DLSHVQEILYVEYEGEPFVTSVEKIYVFENKADLANFIETLQNGTFVLREPEGEDQGVFFIKGEESYNGVLRGSNLGFQYGDFWVQIKDITESLDNMEEKPLVEVRDL
ncbi:MAG TPA: hypothetical protein DHN33_11700, partial [Eubacteriaceae bacterium]|nr:hypothetical protein [Eubacteriaceae bacterium]